jgi:hypothetical protein
MPWKFDPKFVVFRNNMAKLSSQEVWNQVLEYFVHDVLEALERIVRESDIDYREEFSQSFDVENGWRKSGIVSALEIRFVNNADHAIFVARGSDPTSGNPPPALTEWVMNKLGIDEPRDAFMVAKTIFNRGTQSSPNSKLRQLPPRGQKGYDPMLHLEEEGIIEELKEKFTENTRRKIQQVARRGV